MAIAVVTLTLGFAGCRRAAALLQADAIEARAREIAAQRADIGREGGDR